jgi:hypothetical protein
MNRSFEALAAGLAGAVVLTAVHQAAKGRVPGAPEMDVLGKRAIKKGFRGVGLEPPSGDALERAALGGDLTANALFYSLVGLAPAGWAPALGATMGAAAGVAGVALPGPMGLGEGPSNRSTETRAMTVAWYTVGGLAAGLVFAAMRKRKG